MPKVPVKQSDGTIVYMSLDELDASALATPPPDDQPISTQVPAQEPVKNIESSPVEHVTTPPAPEPPKKQTFLTPSQENKKTIPPPDGTPSSNTGGEKQENKRESKESDEVLSAGELLSSFPTVQEIKNNKTSEALTMSKKDDNIPSDSNAELPSFFEPVELEDLPAKASPHELSTTTPVDDYFFDLAKAKNEWDKKDHVSPLEEVFTPGENIHSVSATLPPSRRDVAENITSQLSFAIPVDLQSRFQALVQSRVKDIRTDDQLIEYATRPSEHGGLGITSEQAKELVDVIHRKTPASSTEIIPAPRKTVMKPSAAMNAPKKTEVSSMPPPVMQESSVQGGTLTDIHAPEDVANPVGPIEEIGELTLKDFRRYDRNPAKAVDILKAKVTALQEESYLEYQKVKHAWLESPLYRMYLAQIEDALRERQQLAASLNDELTPDDMIEIAKFSAMLRM